MRGVGPGENRRESCRTDFVAVLIKPDAVGAYAWASLLGALECIYILGIRMHLSSGFDDREY